MWDDPSMNEKRAPQWSTAVLTQKKKKQLTAEHKKHTLKTVSLVNIEQK